MEGYDLLLVTSFFASPPWTKQYGTLQLNDKYELSAAWQTVLYNGPAVGEILELCLNGLVVERIGYRRTKGRTYAELDILFEKGGIFSSPHFTDRELVCSSTIATAPVSTMSIYRPLSGLPRNCRTETFSNFKRLSTVINLVYDELVEHHGEGNQWIVVLGLSRNAIQRLGDERSRDGKSFRFEHDGSTGIIKVPGPGHEITTDRVKTKISFLMLRMGIEDQYWVVATRYQGTGGSKSKEGDQGFLPPTRQPVGTLATGVCPFPTLVIETGVSESLPKLREDVLWWFNHSRGDWQLAPPTTPRPLTRRALQQLQQQVPYPMPPQVQQQPSSQSAYCAQSIEITPQAVTGPSLILPFLAVFGRPPVAPEADLILTTAMLASCIQHL
ncbi:hypothetical protein AFLA_013556 [Aspergillus flavus NRRL3357]|nr:hypothetical protein AFLA_013556 [Aspergillus flavus NRRL3357]